MQQEGAKSTVNLNEFVDTSKMGILNASDDTSGPKIIQGSGRLTSDADEQVPLKVVFVRYGGSV